VARVCSFEIAPTGPASVSDTTSIGYDRSMVMQERSLYGRWTSLSNLEFQKRIRAFQETAKRFKAIVMLNAAAISMKNAAEIDEYIEESMGAFLAEDGQSLREMRNQIEHGSLLNSKLIT
jgi:hypothetical protein